MMSLFFRSVYFFNTLDFSGYAWFVRLMLTLLILAVIVGFFYLLIKTVLMKRDITMMATVIGQEGEVTELLDDFGKIGWVLIYGESWRFKSQTPLKVGDTVKVVKNKKMKLLVQKVEESF